MKDGGHGVFPVKDLIFLLVSPFTDSDEHPGDVPSKDKELLF